MTFLLPGTAVLHETLHHVPIHKGLPAEEIHLQVLPAAGIGDEKIQRLLSHLVAHKGPASVVLPLLRKAVAAGQVAVMGNVEAQSLHHGFALFKIHDKILIDILCQKLLPVDQLLDILQGLTDIRNTVPGSQAAQYLLLLPLGQRSGILQLSHQLGHSLDGIINHRVHHMDGTAVHIQDNIIAIIYILMNHKCTLSF